MAQSAAVAKQDNELLMLKMVAPGGGGASLAAHSMFEKI